MDQHRGHHVTRSALLICVMLVTTGFAPVGIAQEAGDQAPGGPDDGTGEACTFREVEDLGPACRLDDGLWKVRHADGSIGYTHGPDPVPAEAPEGDLGTLGHGGERAPICSEDPGTDYHHVLIYAHAQDDADRYDTIAPELREMISTINGHLHEEARLGGAISADYRFACTDGQVTVHREALPTPASQATFTSIVDDLRALGYDDNQVKYWVWYDDKGACACAGTGHIYQDDALELNNFNNGHPSAIPMFGVTFGYLDGQGLRTMMHENGHNMGAVQSSAPQSSPGGSHCNDGQDIMCYDDSGSLPNEYDPNVCQGYQRFDCNKDDYFHPLPGASNHLADHWNVASQLNRFVRLAVPFEVTAAPTQEVYSPTQTPRIEVQVDSIAGEGIHQADVEIEVRYDTSADPADALLYEAAGCATTWTSAATTHVGSVSIQVESAPERCAGIGFPGELATTPASQWTVEITAMKYGLAETASTSYGVGV